MPDVFLFSRGFFDPHERGRFGDMERLKTALLALAHNPDLRVQLGHRGQEMVEKNHSPDAILNQLDELYKSLETA